MSKPRVGKELSTPTGSTISRQPLGGCEYPSQRADLGTRCNIYPHQTVQMKSSSINQIPVWISTTSRPGLSGFNAVSPRGRRTLSPPQPPPLPPPPPSPQLVPLKARLARSKSTATRPVTSRPDYCQRLRKASDGGAPTRLTNSSSVRTRSTSELRSRIEIKDEPSESNTGRVETSEEKPSVLTVNPSAFLPIAHPTERSPVYVCLANVAFLSLSLLVTSIFSTIFLPFCLIACLIRRTGIWFANVFQYTTCCQCGGFRISNNTLPLIEAIISRLSASLNSTQRCNCFTDKQLENYYGDSLKALSSAELRWLPALEYKYEPDLNGTTCPTLYYSGQSPLVIICLRFGAPGLKLSRLRELISSRLLSRPSDCSSVASSSRGSCLTDKGFSDTSRKRRESSCIPPSDARSRLTQCLTYISTGYAWRECMAFQLEEHVVRLSPTLQRKSEVSSSRPYGSKWEDKHSANSKMINLEVLLDELSGLPLRLDRPLWKAHLMEHFCENDCDETTETSDIESDADSDESSTCQTSHSSRKLVNSNAEKLNKTKMNLINNYNQTYNATSSYTNKRNLNPFVCRRSGASGVGSLLIFQFHAALSDDGKALVNMVTNCLADLPSRTQTPLHSPNKQTPIHTASSLNDSIDEMIINHSVTGITTSKPSSTSTSLSGNNKKKWTGRKFVNENFTYTSENNSNISNDHSVKNASSTYNKNESKWPTTIVSSGNSTSPYNSASFYHSRELSKTILLNEEPSQSNISNITDSKHPSEKSKSNQNESISNNVSTSSSIKTTTTTTSITNSLLDDEDSDESEAAQWWYTFWASSLATIATVCDIIRVLITGPTIIFHKYFITNADMGLITKYQNTKQFKLTNNKNNQITNNGNNNNNSNEDIKIVHKCALLSLSKLSRLRQITKASYSELILSLLAGALRGYHQTMGFKHPPDLLAFLSTEVPVLPSCHLTTSSVSISNCNNNEDPPCTTLSRVLNITQRVRTNNLDFLHISPWRQQQQQRIHHDNNTVETGLLGNTNRMVALSSPTTNTATKITTTRNLCPGRSVLTEFCLPINTEGMLPRLWETKQRLTELNTSVDSLCLAWARTALYTLMPHSVAKWIETTYGGPAKSSVTITGVEVISPFTTTTTTTSASSSKITDSNYSYQMPKSRRLAYMSLLASKSSDARILRQRLRKRLSRGTTTATSAVYPPRLGTSFRALARHLVNANAGIMYIAGCPIIRIDTWMPSPVNRPSQFISNSHLAVLDNGVNKSASNETVVHVCRDLSVTYTTYAGQLSLAFSASSKQCIHPNLDLIISSIKSQLNKMCQLLSGRHVPSMTSRWLRHSSSTESSSVSALSAISMSPSLNPSLVLHNEMSKTNEQTNTSTTASFSSSPVNMPTNNSSTNVTDEINSSKDEILSCRQLNSEYSSHNSIVSQYIESNNSINKNQSRLCSSDGSKSIQFYQVGQPIEQLQEQLRWVQRQLEESSNAKNIVGSTTANNIKLAKLRSEFCILLRQLKQRCSQGELGIDSSLSDLNNEFQDISYESKLNCASISRSGNSSPQKSAQATSGYPCLNGQFNVNPFRAEQSSTIKRSITTGDFDEDPDFYITGQPDADDFDDIDSSESEFALKEASNAISEIFKSTPNVDEHESIKNHRTPNNSCKRNKVDGNEGELFRKKKRIRKNITTSGRRRPSKKAVEVISLNFIPSRRERIISNNRQIYAFHMQSSIKAPTTELREYLILWMYSNPVSMDITRPSY
ncbi:unnamed protein product [Schistosoma turkestanicum]|nr:unnamed protein product [Schistosoma turkestanicum]